MIDLKILDKANAIYQQIKKLDAEIIELDQFALLIANDEIKATFTLNVPTNQVLDEQKEDSPTVRTLGELAAHLRSLAQEQFAFNQSGGICNGSKPKLRTLKADISECTTLKMLGLLLGDKQENRLRLVRQLKNLGVNI